jgi:hypothetical protein
MCRANIISTGRYESVFNPVMAKVALLSDAFTMVEINGIIGAGFETGLTTTTQGIIHHYDPVGPLANRLFGADIDTGRFITVPAQFDTVNKTPVFVDTPGPIFQNSNKFHAVGSAVFLLAGNLTGFTSPAGIVINFDGIDIHQVSSLSAG